MLCKCVTFFVQQCFLCTLFLGRSLSLWAVTKKKPLCTVKAHQAADESKAGTPRESWITSVASVRNTDLIASGKMVHFKWGSWESTEKTLRFEYSQACSRWGEGTAPPPTQ
jgi:hypothetical protein